MCSNGSDRAANCWSLVGLGTCAPMAAIVLPIVGPWLVWVHVLQWQRSCCQLLVLGWSGYMCSNGGNRAADSWSLVGLGTCAPMAASLVGQGTGYMFSNGGDRAANSWSMKLNKAASVYRRFLPMQCTQ